NILLVVSPVNVVVDMHGYFNSIFLRPTIRLLRNAKVADCTLDLLTSALAMLRISPNGIDDRFPRNFFNCIVGMIQKDCDPVDGELLLHLIQTLKSFQGQLNIIPYEVAEIFA